jgi:RNA polymerase sigma-70 factor, ECF subfamily
LPVRRVYLGVSAEVPGYLEPYPDALLDDLPEQASETVSLAFVAALQCLPPRQRAALILHDVAGFTAAEVAGLLGTAEHAVRGLLDRARGTLAARLPGPDRAPAPPPRSARERKIVAEFTRAFERADIRAVLALLTDDVALTMPPLPQSGHGRAAAGHVLGGAFRAGRRYRLLSTHANRQPAFGCYLAGPRTPVLHADGLLVLTLSGDRICTLTRFTDNALLARFGFPLTLGEATGLG